MFHLKTASNELASANAGRTRLQYEQVTSQRGDISGGSFTNGNINFRWSSGGNKWWLPARSYLRLRCSLTKVGGASLDAADNIAPAMNTPAGLFQSCEFRINERTLSRVSNYVAQVDSIHKRARKSAAWLDTAGASGSLWQPSAEVRSGVVSTGMTVPLPISIPATAARLDLGVPAATTVAFTAATGVVAFAAAAITNLAEVFPIGSEFVFTTPGPYADAAAGNLNKPMEVAAVDQGAQTITLVIDGQVGLADEGAAILNFSRVDGSIQPDVPSRAAKDLELIWQPPLSIFDYEGALPAGKYELQLTPQTQAAYKQMAIESLLGDKTAGVDYDFVVNSLLFYIATVEGPQAPSDDYMIDLRQIRMQAENVTSTSLNQKFFEVSPSTRELAFAFQDSRVTSSTATRFTASKFTGENRAERALTRFYYQYAGLSQPSPDADPAFDSTANRDYTAQRYLESAIYNGGWYDTAGPERIEDWDERGRFYYFQVPRSQNDRSTRVQVNAEFAAGTDVTNLNLLCFDISSQVAVIKVVGGAIADVIVEDV